MPIERRVLREPVDVATRLSELNLAGGVLRAAVDRGFAAGSSCTSNDPRAMAGFLRWGKTLRGLRDGMVTVPAVWTSAVVDQIDVVLNEKTGLGITVASGDFWTGTENDPTTKYPRGGAIVAATLTNARQLSLFPAASPPKPVPTLRQLWLLLIYAADDEVRCELSLPAAIDAGNRVSLWLERIILEPLRFDPPASFKGDEGDGGADDIDVPVTRRG